MATTHGAHAGDPLYDWDAGGWWALAHYGDWELPTLVQLANPDELSAFVAERRREGDTTCRAISDAEARALTVADIHEYRNAVV